MVVQHNMTAVNANRYLGINNNKLSKSLEKLSSGFAINRAGDNAAGLAVSEKMRAQINGIDQAIKNSEDGISMVQTFEGALTETHSILQRMKTLATQSANGTYDNSVDRSAIQQEYNQLNDELNQIADTDFNGVVVLNGGTMSDGIKADANGLIDYANAKRDAQQIGTTGNFVKGISTDGFTTTLTTKETVTFTAAVGADGKVSWTSDNDTDPTVADDDGGFKYKGAGIHIDTSKIVAGDTITIEFDPPVDAVKNTANVVGTTTTTLTGDETALTTKPTITSVTIADANVTPLIDEALKALNNITIETSWDASTTAATVTTKVNDAAGTLTTLTGTSGVEVAGLSDGNKLIMAGDGKIYVGKDLTTMANNTQIGAFTKGAVAAANTKGAGSVSTVIKVSQSTSKPAEAAKITIVEPDAKVSQANSNVSATAKLQYANDITLQVGARTKDSVNFTFKYNSDAMGKLEADLNCTAKGLGTDKLDLSTQESANAAIDKIGDAINKVSMVRSSFGAIQNRLEHKIDNLNVTSENLTAAESRIRDTDMAKEMMNFTKNQILAQASQSMLAQANQLPQGVMSLLQ